MKRSQLREVVAGALEVTPEELDPATDLKTIPTFDSVGILTLMIALEEKAGFGPTPEQCSRLRYYWQIEDLARQEGITLDD